MTNDLAPHTYYGKTLSARPPNARQRRVFDYIVEYKRAHDGDSPTIRQIGEACEITSTSVVNYTLTRLEAVGWIRRPKGEARGIRVPGGRWTYTALDTERSVAGAAHN